MIPTRLNLLSPEKQNYLHKMVYVQFLKHLLELVLFLVTLVAIILLGADAMLHSYFSSITNKVDVSTHRINEVNQNVQFINTTVSRVRIIQSEFLSWPNRVEEVSSVIPEGIVLKAMKFNEKQYIFSGTANTRDNLLAYQAALEELPYILSVSFPISQLTQKEDIQFSITATLK